MTLMNLRAGGALAALGATVALGAGAIAISSTDEVEERAAVAAAKCSLPVDERAGLHATSTGTSARKQDVTVTSLGEGSYRVTGRVLGHEENGHVGSFDFTCEVAPDATDQLRGFRITTLTVTPQ